MRLAVAFRFLDRCETASDCGATHFDLAHIEHLLSRAVARLKAYRGGVVSDSQNRQEDSGGCRWCPDYFRLRLWRIRRAFCLSVRGFTNPPIGQALAACMA